MCFAHNKTCVVCWSGAGGTVIKMIKSRNALESFREQLEPPPDCIQHFKANTSLFVKSLSGGSSARADSVEQ